MIVAWEETLNAGEPEEIVTSGVEEILNVVEQEEIVTSGVVGSVTFCGLWASEEACAFVGPVTGSDAPDCGSDAARGDWQVCEWD